MAVPSNENYVASLLIGSGSRSIEARMASVEGILQYGPDDPEYFPDIDARKMSIFGYDENGNPGYWSGEFVFSRVPYALEIDGTPVDGAIEYNVTGTVSYSTGLGVNSALPATFQRIPDYNTKVAFSTTGAIFLDIDEATDLPYGQGYFTGSQFWLEMKTEDGVSRFYGTSSGQIEDVTNWTAFTNETGANTLSVSPPVDVTIAAPGQMIESLSDTASIWFRGNSGIHRIPEIDEFGFLRVNGVQVRKLGDSLLNTEPRDGEIVALTDKSYVTVTGNGETPVVSLRWDGFHRIEITDAFLATMPTISGTPVVRVNATQGIVAITESISADFYISLVEGARLVFYAVPQTGSKSLRFAKPTGTITDEVVSEFGGDIRFQLDTAGTSKLEAINTPDGWVALHNFGGTLYPD